MKILWTKYNLKDYRINFGKDKMCLYFLKVMADKI